MTSLAPSEVLHQSLFSDMLSNDHGPWHRGTKLIGKETDSGESSYFQDASFPKVTISSYTEAGRVESSITVPNQQAYIGMQPVIPSCLADTPCATLGTWCLLDILNSTLRSSHTLNTPSLSSVLEECITKNYDFGTAYERLHRILHGNNNWGNIQDTLCRWEEEDQKM